jgi:hypothetical protein
MRKIIQRHNRLNGLVFSMAEFLFIGLIAGVFATYYIIHWRWLMAFVGCGITLNCMPVVVDGWCQLIKERGGGRFIGSYYSDKTAREQHRRENPHMLRDTLVFVVAALLPFVMLLATMLDRPRHDKT